MGYLILLPIGILALICGKAINYSVRGGDERRPVGILTCLLLGGVMIGIGYWEAFVGWNDRGWKTTLPVAGWIGMLAGGFFTIGGTIWAAIGKTRFDAFDDDKVEGNKPEFQPTPTPTSTPTIGPTVEPTVEPTATPTATPTPTPASRWDVFVSRSIVIGVAVVIGIIVAACVLHWSNNSENTNTLPTPTIPTSYYGETEAIAIIRSHIQDVVAKGLHYTCYGNTFGTFHDFHGEYEAGNSRWLVFANSSTDKCTFFWYLYEKSGIIQAVGNYQ